MLDFGTKESCMTKFYFGFQKTAGTIAQDDVGQDMPGLEEAKAAAIESAREMLAHDVKFARTDPLLAITIKDEDGKELTRISVKDILPEPLR
jgi:hypothetical protein